MTTYKEKCKKEAISIMKYVFWITIAAIFIFMCSSILLAADFVDTDGVFTITWDKPDDISNLKGYQVEVYGPNEFKNVKKIFEGVEPPVSFNTPAPKEKCLAIVKVFSISLNGTLGKCSTVSVEVIPPEAPQNLEVK